MAPYPRTVACPDCSGTGRCVRQEEITCPECHGTGVLPDPGVPALCPKCDGMLELTVESSGPCARCGGTGELLVNDPAGMAALSGVVPGDTPTQVGPAPAPAGPGAGDAGEMERRRQFRQQALAQRAGRPGAPSPTCVQQAGCLLVLALLTAAIVLVVKGSLPWWSLLVAVPFLGLISVVLSFMGGGRRPSA